MNAQTKVETSTLSAAMAKAFAKIEAATKGAVNPHFKSKYADLPAVIEAIKPALIENSLFFTQCPRESEGGVAVETILHHASGESMSLGTVFVPANKNDAHGHGSALTYARRYGLQTGFGVPAEDDDGNAAVASAAEPKYRAPPAKPIPDAMRDEIAALAPGAGKTLQEICDAYKIQSLKELTQEQGSKLIERLRAPKAVANA